MAGTRGANAAADATDAANAAADALLLMSRSGKFSPALSRRSCCRSLQSQNALRGLQRRFLLGGLGGATKGTDDSERGGGSGGGAAAAAEAEAEADDDVVGR